MGVFRHELNRPRRYMRAYTARYDGAKCYFSFFFFVFVTAVDWFGNAEPEGENIWGRCE